MPFRDGDVDEGRMTLEVKQVTPGDAPWPSVAGLLPKAVLWLGDATDEGDHCFFAATDAGAFAVPRI